MIIKFIRNALVLFLFIYSCKPAGKIYKAEKDAVFEHGSNINLIVLDSNKVQILTNLGMLWGFLKYYHPLIARGEFNWDAELFRVLPQVIAAPDKDAAYEIMETWVDALGPVSQSGGQENIIDNVKLRAEFGFLFIADNLPASLVHKLRAIRDNHRAFKDHYYIGFADPVRNPVFKNERPYAELSSPDAGIRLLALYRYWNMIQYFYPNRHLIQENWNTVLAQFIPKFIQAGNKAEYILACLELIGHVHDTHANIWGKNPLLDSLKGKMITPFQAKFIEKQLVVTGFYKNDSLVKQQIKVGDIIERIDGIPVDDLMKTYLPYSPASNEETQLRVLTSSHGFLLRANKTQVSLLVKRGHLYKHIRADRIPLDAAQKNLDWMQYPQQGSHRILESNIGYIYPAKLCDKSIDTIKKALNATKGIVIDMRCYPASFMPFTYGDWLKEKFTPFVKFSIANSSRPGTFTYTETYSNGGGDNYHYKGQVVILVNEMTQSQAEYTTMALSSAPNAVVMGSTTAGADGNVSEIVLPCGIRTMISGIGIYYPDGTETQRVGVKIDIPVRPTIKGIEAGRDELLEQAINYIKTNK